MHTDCRGRKRVCWREEEGAPVLAVVVGGAWGAGEDVVPF